MFCRIRYSINFNLNSYIWVTAEYFFLDNCNTFHFFLFLSHMCRLATLNPLGSEETRKPGWFVRPQGLASGTSMYSLRDSFSSSAHMQSFLLLMEVMHLHWKTWYFVVSPLRISETESRIIQPDKEISPQGVFCRGVIWDPTFEMRTVMCS